MLSAPPYEVLGENRNSEFIVFSDHASNSVPHEFGGTLGLEPEDVDRHISYDVGIAGVARALGKHLDAVTILTRFSRLVIDVNRGLEDPTLIMQISDGTIVPANRNLSESERKRRIAELYRPYHDKLAELSSRIVDPCFISVHSFAPQMRGDSPRPWHFGVIYGDDDRVALPLIKTLRLETRLCVGDNQPYSGQLPGDSLTQHAVPSRRRHVLLEIRNDLIEREKDQEMWGKNIAGWIMTALSHRFA